MEILNINNSARNHKLFIKLLNTILIIGVTLRLFHYVYNRSLWLDEEYLASSLLHMNYRDLATATLDYSQKAPIGFLWMVKTAVYLFGKNEYALRLIPLLSGIISLFLFSRICRKLLSPLAAIIALGLFAFAPALVYHSVEIKQYAIEGLATTLALQALLIFEPQRSWRSKLYWGGLGAVLIWFSFAVIFILGGIAIGITLNNLLKKRWQSLLRNSFPFLLWLISFSVNYLLFTHKHAESDWIVYFFRTYDNFMPLPPHSLSELKWFPRNFIAMMDYPLGLPFPVLPSVLLIAGIYFLNKNSKKLLYVLVIPILLTLLASGLELYPLIERFWVFLSPVLILLIAYGFEYCQQRIKMQHATTILTLLLLAGPALQSVFFLVRPERFYKHKKSFERESLSYVNQNYKADDAVYNYWNNKPGYGVYQQIFSYRFQGVQGRDFRKTSANLADYNKHLLMDINPLRAKKRIWVIFGTTYLNDIGDMVDDPKWYYKNGEHPTENLVHVFSKIGQPVQKKIYGDITVYLFDLQKNN